MVSKSALYRFLAPAAAMAMLLGTQVTAHATGPSLAVAPTYGQPTSNFFLHGFGYPAADTLDVLFDSTVVGSAVTNAAGAFTAKFQVPAAALPGAHSITASDAVGFGASAPFSVHFDWRMARADASGSGFNQYENVLSASNVPQLAQIAAPQWGAFLHSAPTYIDGTLFAASSDGTVRAINPLNGNFIWTFSTPTGAAITGSPIDITGPGKAIFTLVVGAADGSLYALNGGSGRELWSVATGAPISGSPIAYTLNGGTDIALVNDGTMVQSYDASGHLLWNVSLTGSSIPGETVALIPAVQLPDGTTHAIIVVCFGGGVEAIDAANGTPLWLNNAFVPTSSPTVYGSGTGARIVFGADPTAVELNAGTGAEVWASTVSGNITGGLALYKTMVPGTNRFALQWIVAADSNGVFYFFKHTSGGKALVVSGAAEGPISSLTIANGVVYAGLEPTASTDGGLVAISGSGGTVLFRADTADLSPQPYPPAPPTVADGMVFIGDYSGGLRVFAPTPA